MRNIASFFLNVGVSLVILGGLVLSGPYIQNYFYPASDFFVVKHVRVSDHFEGEDPSVDYGRVIKKPFEAQWWVEIDKMEGGQFTTICPPGTGRNHYTPDDRLPEDLRLSWYVGRICNLPSGVYQLTSVWELDYGLPFKVRVQHRSDPFEVFPSGSKDGG